MPPSLKKHPFHNTIHLKHKKILATYMIPLTVYSRNLNYFQFGWYSNILDDLWKGKRVPIVPDAKVNAADVNHIINPEKISSILTNDQSATMSGFKSTMLYSKVQRYIVLIWDMQQNQLCIFSFITNTTHLQSKSCANVCSFQWRPIRRTAGGPMKVTASLDI